MYKKNSLLVLPTSCILKSDIDFSERSKYRPMSYYVQGGIDLDGDALRDGAQTSFDSPDDIAGVDCVAEATSDPRVSALDIIENAGIQAYEKYKDELARSKAQALPQSQQAD